MSLGKWGVSKGSKVKITPIGQTLGFINSPFKRMACVSNKPAVRVISFCIVTSSKTIGLSRCQGVIVETVKVINFVLISILSCNRLYVAVRRAFAAVARVAILEVSSELHVKGFTSSSSSPKFFTQSKALLNTLSTKTSALTTLFPVYQFTSTGFFYQHQIYQYL